MPPQTDHDVEVHRQHLRLRVPVQVEIDGVRYQVDDWSIGGFGVESVMISRQLRERFPARLIFPFEEFDMSMRLEARLVHADQDHGRFGCAFVGLSREQVAVLRYLVGAYLAGEVVTAGDLLRIRARDGADDVRPERVPEVMPETPASPSRWRQRITMSGLGFLGGILAIVVALALRELPQDWQMQSAVVEGPVVMVRAPRSGWFEARLAPGEPAPPETVIGAIHLPEGNSLPVESPCECVVLEPLAGDGRMHAEGDSLVALLEADRPLLLRTGAPLDAVPDLAPGGRVEIQRIGGDQAVAYGQIASIELRPGLEALRRDGVAPPLPQAEAQVLIRPDRPLQPGDFGALMSVRFL